MAYLRFHNLYSHFYFYLFPVSSSENLYRILYRVLYLTTRMKGRGNSSIFTKLIRFNLYLIVFIFLII